MFIKKCFSISQINGGIMGIKDMIMKVIDISKMKRNDVVPYYTLLIITDSCSPDVARFNELIISKWSTHALLYIKNKAWEMADSLGYTFENGWGNKSLIEIYGSITSLKNKL